MKSIPKTTNDWSALSDIVGGGLRQRIFSSALRLKIFDHVDRRAAEEIAARLSAHPRNTELFLNVLTGMGLIRKRDGKYELTETSAEFLVSESPAYLGTYLLHVGSFHEQFPVALDDLVRKGPPQTPLDMGNEAMWAESARLSAAYQYGGEAQRIARIAAGLPEFPGMSRMLDLGGGAGFYTLAIVSSHPSMNGVVLEQPSVARVAEGFVREYGMESRVSVVAGDYMKDDLRGPYDLIFASATLNFFKNRFDDLFRRVRAALAPGGIFMTHQDGIREERTKPVNLIAEFLLPEMMGADFAIPQGEIAETMLRNGFQSAWTFAKQSSIGEMEVTIGRAARKDA